MVRDLSCAGLVTCASWFSGAGGTGRKTYRDWEGKLSIPFIPLVRPSPPRGSVAENAVKACRMSAWAGCAAVVAAGSLLTTKCHAAGTQYHRQQTKAHPLAADGPSWYNMGCLGAHRAPVPCLAVSCTSEAFSVRASPRRFHGDPPTNSSSAPLIIVYH